MNEKVIPIEEVRTEVLAEPDFVEFTMGVVAREIHESAPLLTEKKLTEREYSRVEWVLRSAEELLPQELHQEFQDEYLKRWWKYIETLQKCTSFDNQGLPISGKALQARHRLLIWSNEYVNQNSSKIQEYMNKSRRKELLLIVNLLNSVLSMTKKKEALHALETALSDIELAKDEEEMAKDSLPENFFLTERYGNMEDNVNDLYDAIGTLEDVIDDVTSLSRFSQSLVKEPINEIINNIKTVINR